MRPVDISGLMLKSQLVGRLMQNMKAMPEATTQYQKTLAEKEAQAFNEPNPTTETEMLVIQEEEEEEGQRQRRQGERQAGRRNANTGDGNQNEREDTLILHEVEEERIRALEKVDHALHDNRTLAGDEFTPNTDDEEVRNLLGGVENKPRALQNGDTNDNRVRRRKNNGSSRTDTGHIDLTV